MGKVLLKQKKTDGKKALLGILGQKDGK